MGAGLRGSRIIAALAALTSVVAGCLLARHYPVAPLLAVAAFLLWSVLSCCWPRAWLLAVPALLPITGLATWTGWFAFEELDLLVLGAAAGGYARRALSYRPPVEPPEPSSSEPSVALLAAGVAVLSGGAYMSNRLSSTADDVEARIRHWKHGIALLRGEADWWLGKGLGRFPPSYFFSPPNGAFPGSYFLRHEGAEHFLSLAGPSYPTAWGELFRVAQRVSSPPGIYTATLELRALQDAQVHLEICEQHLLYNGACAVSAIRVRAEPGWQRSTTTMEGRQLSRGPWYAPRLMFFALAVESNGRSIDVRAISLISPEGRNLLVNGDFAEGMVRWIPISERLHLPWHIKNLALNLLFDQGIVGLIAFSLLLAAALWRVTLGAARDHVLSPFLAASLVGFTVVGAFDSLLDVPRVAFLFYVLVMASLLLPVSAPSSNASRERGPPGRK